MAEQHAAADAFLAERHALFIGGQWYAPRGEMLSVENPADGREIARLGTALPEDVDAAVAAARAAFPAWGSSDPALRSRLLLRLADLIEADAPALAVIESRESGMPVHLAQSTLAGMCCDLLRYYSGWCTKITGETITARPGWTPGGEWLIYTRREPLGVVAAIIPWNAPAAMIALKIAPALAAGCCMVLKPAELTPLLAVRFAALIEQAGFPAGVFNLVQGTGGTVGRLLAAHPGVDKIAFTGSTAVGKEIVRAAASDLKRVSLELGGKSPFVVFPDADLDQAVPAAAMACFALSGQNCMAATRMFVAAAIHDEFVARVAEAAGHIIVGDPADPSTALGPLVSQAQRDKVAALVTRAVIEGARVVCGGTPSPGPGCFFPPTVLADVTPSMEVAQSEVFGPVMSVLRFNPEDEAGLLEAINGTIYGLSGSVWTRDISRAHRLAARIDSGQVAINAHAAVSPETPFGGNRQSGWGREFGREGLDAYLKTKAVSVQLTPAGIGGG